MDQIGIRNLGLCIRKREWIILHYSLELMQPEVTAALLFIGSNAKW